MYQYRFIDIAKQYLLSSFIFDVLSTLTIFFNYQYEWMYYLKFFRIVIYSFRAKAIMDKTIDSFFDNKDWCQISKQAR